MKIDLAHWVESLKASNAFILAGIVLILLSSIITITKAAGILIKWYQRTIGYKRGFRRKIDKLSADTNIEYFRSVLGSPAFINQQDGMIEYIFVLGKLAYVQALTNDHGRVLAYSVTTRTHKFNPSITLGPYTLDGRPIIVSLGKTRFHELDTLNTPEGIVCFVGAHNYYYSERYYFGNPGNYQDYCFSQNQSGEINEYSPMLRQEEVSIDHPEIKAFRQCGVINTFTVTSPLMDKKLDTLTLGPTYDQVRVARAL